MVQPDNSEISIFYIDDFNKQMSDFYDKYGFEMHTGEQMKVFDESVTKTTNLDEY